jgi:Tol biopolymer transport system component
MKQLLVATLTCFAVLAGVAAASSAPRPTGQIVFGMNHFCLTQGGNGGGKVPVDCGKGEIAVVDADGTHLRVLTHDNVTEVSPRWSPDHRQIAFIKPRAHTSSQIWVMNADGSNQRVVVRSASAHQLYGEDVVPSLDWSPTGRQIVFSAFTGSNGGRTQLYLASVRTGHVSRLTYAATGATDPVWSPDGRWIAFVGAIAPDRIYLLSTQTHRIHALGNATGMTLGWSPDGKRLAYNSRGKLQLLNVVTRHYRSLGVYGDQPSWSPDGRWLVFTSGDYVKEIRPDGKGNRHILYVSSKKGWNFQPDW